MMWQDWDQEVVAVKFAGTVLSAENLFNYSHRNGEEQNYSLYKFITSILDFCNGRDYGRHADKARAYPLTQEELTSAHYLDMEELYTRYRNGLHVSYYKRVRLQHDRYALPAVHGLS